MTKIEALELELAARKMVEGMGVYWWKCVRRNTIQFADEGFAHHIMEQFDDIELAIGIIEGRPAFEGDEVFCPTADPFVMQDGKRKLIVAAANAGCVYNITMKDGGVFQAELLSWNTPKPKTVIVELPISEARHLSRYLSDSYNESRIAIKKALEELK